MTEINRRSYVADVITALEETSSRKEKEKILSDAKDMKIPYVKEVLLAAYDPFRQYYIRKIPDYDKEYQLPSVQTGMKHFLAFLNVLSDRSLTGNAARDRLSKELGSVARTHKFLAERIILKDLRCGVSASTINKIWPKLIPTFDVMLCTALNQKVLEDFIWPGYVQEKMDAMRIVSIVNPDGTVEHRSRNGRPLSLHGALDVDVLRIYEKQPKSVTSETWVLDGEILFMNEDNTDYLPRKKSNGLGTKAIKGTLSEKDAKRARAIYWDVVNYDSFNSGETVISYRTRFAFLKTIMAFATDECRVRVIENIEVESLHDMKKYYEKILKRGGEGVILKDPRGGWKNKRVKHQIKFKVEEEADLIIIGIEKGTGRNEDRLGNFICSTKDGIVEVSVGSGFSDEEREAYYSENMVGKIVTVKYNEIIGHAVDEDKRSLYLPVFVEIREDKDIANTYDELAKQKKRNISV